MWLLLTAALAAPSTDRYPQSAPVALQPGGIQRIHVPAAMHDVHHPLTERNLLLLNGAGERVPFAVLAGGEERETTSARPSSPNGREPVGIWPTPERNRFQVAIRDRVQEELEITFPGRPLWAITARLLDADGTVLDETLLWSLGGRAHGRVKLPDRLGTFRLELTDGSAEALDPKVRALRSALTHIPDEEVRVELVQSGLQENGWSRWDVVSDHPYPLAELTLDVSEDLFDRQAGVDTLDLHALPDTLPRTLSPGQTTRIQRVELAGSRVQETTLDVDREPPLAVLVSSSSNQPPLELLGATGTFRGIHLVVRDPGPGPHTLYAGGDAREGRSDLQFAAAELERIAGRPVETGAVVPNPAYVPPEARGALGDPGRELNLDGFAWERELTGTPGLVRVPLDDALLDHAKPTLADIRIVDADGRQLPYIVRSDRLEHTWGDLPFERTERSGESVLRIPLPKPNVQVGSVTLTTSAPVFDRRVRVARARGPRLETLRAYDWRGDGTPGVLTLDVHKRVGDELVVLIDNGDDPPLPIDTVRVDWPGWEVLAVMPPSGTATLLYGKPSLDAPRYDFALLREALGRRVTAVATVGPEATRKARPLSVLDRIMLGVGIAVMALGLLGLALLLLRRPPEPPEAAAPEPADDPPGPPPFEAPEDAVAPQGT